MAYKKNVSRDANLVTFEVWVESDTNYLKEWINVTTPRVILENNDGLITAYEDEQIFKDAENSILELLKKDNWLNDTIELYGGRIDRAKEIFNEFQKNPSREKLKNLFEQLAKTQGGLAVVYFVPTIEKASEGNRKLALEERKNTESFFYDIDKWFTKAISLLYPDHGEYRKILSIYELISDKLPSKTTLENRERHFIYYDKSFQDLGSLGEVENNLNIEVEGMDVDHANKDRFVRMWTEENYNYYDLLPIVRNYGPEMILGFGAKEVIAYARDFHAELYLKEKELENFGNNGYEYYINKNGLGNLLNRTNKEIPATQKAIKHLISIDLKRLTGKELMREYINYFKPLGDLFGSYITTQPQFVAKIEEKLKNEFAKYPNKEEIISILTRTKTEFVFSDKGDFFKKSFAELLASEDAEVDMHILDEPLYTGKLVDQTEKEQIIKENSIPDEIIKMADIIGGIAEARLKMRFTWMPALYFLELFLIEIKRRYKVSKKTIRKYDEAELDELIKKGKKINKEILAKRMTGFAKVLKNGEIKTLVGDEANKLIESINKIEDGIKELRGVVASRGLVSGKVRLFSYGKSENHSKQIRLMEKGDIIVTEMTRPNILPAIKKAGAIVTDEGGITSHAAIVSRELKVPCVIGTKIATQVLKDGMEVEVDANEGIVRII